MIEYDLVIEKLPKVDKQSYEVSPKFSSEIPKQLKELGYNPVSFEFARIKSLPSIAIIPDCPQNST